MNGLTLEQQIEVTRDKLEAIAVVNDYNFIHPAVLAISRKLDELVVQVMQSRKLGVNGS